MTSRALRPLGEVARRADEISTRSLSARLPVPEAKDEVHTLVVVLNRMMSRLEEGFQRISRFTADASHELRTPLAVMRAELEALQQQRDPTAGAPPDRIESLLGEVRRLTGLVDSLLLLSRADGQGALVEKQPFDLTRAVLAAAEDARLLGEERTLEVECIAAPGIQVRVDPSRIRQILLNLIDNAVKFNRPGGRIRILLDQPGDRARVVIGNNGAGLSEAQRGRLFERFFRGDPARSRAVPGFGLGLALSRELARAHGGDLVLSDTRPDWTEFALTLGMED